MSKKRKKRSGIGATIGAAVGGSAGYRAGQERVKFLNMQNDVRQRGQATVRKQDDVLRSTIRSGQRKAERMNREGKRKAEFMNTFFRRPGEAKYSFTPWAFNTDPKVVKQLANNQRYLNKSLRSTKGVIAKYTIPPAVVGGVVGHFLEKKAEGEIQMSKANEVMEKLAAGGWLKVLTGVANRARVLGGVAGKPIAKAMNTKTMKQLDHMGKVQASRAAKAQAKLDAGVGSSKSLANQAVKLDDAQRAGRAIDKAKIVVDDLRLGRRDYWSAGDKLDDLAHGFKDDMSVFTRLNKNLPGFKTTKPTQILKEPAMPPNMVAREVHTRGGEELFRKTVEKMKKSDLPAELKGLVGKGK